MNTDANYVCVLECKSQSPTQHFVLGRVEPQGECIGQLGWSRDRWPLTVLCDGCFGLFEYSEQDIRKVSVDSMDQETLQPKRIWNIEVQCGQENCGFPIRMHFQAGIGSVREHVLLKIDGHKVPCPKCRRPIELTSQSCKNVNAVT